MEGPIYFRHYIQKSLYIYISRKNDRSDRLTVNVRLIAATIHSQSNTLDITEQLILRLALRFKLPTSNPKIHKQKRIITTSVVTIFGGTPRYRGMNQCLNKGTIRGRLKIYSVWQAHYHTESN